MHRCQRIHSCDLNIIGHRQQRLLPLKDTKWAKRILWDIRTIEREDVIKKKRAPRRRREKDSLTSLPLVPRVIFLCGVVQFSVNSTSQPYSPPSLIAPSHPLVATQLQIKDAHVLGDFTEFCLVVAISSLMPHKDRTQLQMTRWA